MSTESESVEGMGFRNRKDEVSPQPIDGQGGYEVLRGKEIAPNPLQESCAAASIHQVAEKGDSRKLAASGLWGSRQLGE